MKSEQTFVEIYETTVHCDKRCIYRGKLCFIGLYNDDNVIDTVCGGNNYHWCE